MRDTYDFNVTLLINVTRDAIIEALDDLREKLGEKANLLIYYAGHGWLDEDVDRGYWLPVDAKANRRSERPVSSLRRLFRADCNTRRASILQG